MNTYPLDNYDVTIQNIKDYLSRHGRYNSVAQNLNSSDLTSFLCELIAAEHLFFLKIRIDQTIGFVLCDLYPLISIAPNNRQIVSLYCMRKTSEWKACTLQLDVETNAVLAHVESSFRDAPMSSETFAYLEQLLVSSMLSCCNELIMVSLAGIDPTSANDIQSVADVPMPSNSDTLQELTQMLSTFYQKGTDAQATTDVSD